MNLKTEWVLKSSTGTCETLPVPVEVPSENYEGWQGLEVIEDPGCSKMGEGLFDQNRAVKRVELAPTLLNGKSGFLKIVYENLSEYGPETIKTFLRCRVED